MSTWSDGRADLRAEQDYQRWLRSSDEPEPATPKPGREIEDDWSDLVWLMEHRMRQAPAPHDGSLILGALKQAEAHAIAWLDTHGWPNILDRNNLDDELEDSMLRHRDLYERSEDI